MSESVKSLSYIPINSIGNSQSNFTMSQFVYKTNDERKTCERERYQKRQAKYTEKFKQYKKLSKNSTNQEKFLELIYICYPDLRVVPAELLSRDIELFIDSIHDH